MNYLVYINSLGVDHKTQYIYEFIFSNTTEVWGNYWDHKPASGYPEPPELKYIKKVGILKNNDVKLELAQNSDFFSFMDSMDDVVALGWENDDDIEFSSTEKRLVFRFGESEEKIKEKLYERDLILEFEKNIIYEN
jgi:hypothetical protein